MITRRTTTGVLAGALAVAAMLLAGCASAGDTPSSEGDGTASTSVKIVNGKSMDFAPYWVAAEKGFFAENGIDATMEFTTATSTADIAALLVGGEFNLGPSTVSVLANSVAKGLDLQMITALATVGGEEDKNNQMFVASDGPADMAALGEPDVVLGVLGGPKDVLGALSKNAIAEAGGDPEAPQMQTTPAQQLADLIAAGSVTGGPLIQPFATMAAANPGLKSLGSITAVLPEGSPQVGLAASKEWIAGNPDGVEGLQKAIAQAIEWIADPANADEYIDIVVEQTGLDVAVVEKVTRPIYSARMNREAVEHYIEVLLEYGTIESAVSPDEIILPEAFN